MAVSDYRDQMPIIDGVPLRQCALAVSVLDDVDLTPTEDGVLLPGTPDVVVGWEAIQDAVGNHPVQGDVARRRVSMLLRLHRLAADLGPEAARRFHNAARVVALPPGHADHPGPGWVQQPLRGRALELGIGVQGLLDEPDRSVSVPPSVLRMIGVEPTDWWPPLREHAERMGALAAARLVRGNDSNLIRPVGGCDVLALLSSRSLRRHICESDGSGLQALAVPTRRRGWYDVRQVDPEFVQVAWSLTDEHERGLPIPLLVTADEVSLPFPRPEAGRP
jgi:hypothetical protein